MNNLDRLAKLGCTEFASIDEIKRAFRKLAIKTHPDHGGDTATFIAIKQAYDVLLKTHSPKNKSSTSDFSGHRTQLYRILDTRFSHYVLIVPLPDILDCEVIIYCMRGAYEFTIVVPKYTRLPVDVVNTNFKPPLRIKIVNHSDINS